MITQLTFCSASCMLVSLGTCEYLPLLFFFSCLVFSSISAPWYSTMWYRLYLFAPTEARQRTGWGGRCSKARVSLRFKRGRGGRSCAPTWMCWCRLWWREGSKPCSATACSPRVTFLSNLDFASNLITISPGNVTVLGPGTRNRQRLGAAWKFEVKTRRF